MNKPIKPKNFRSLSFTLAITFSILIVVVLVFSSALLMYFSFQAQQRILINNQQLVAQNAANIVEDFLREKISILETIAGKSKLVDLPDDQKKPVLEKLLGLEPIFRQLIIFNSKEKEMIRVSRISKLLAEKSMDYSLKDLFVKVKKHETYISPVYIDEITSEPMIIMAVPITDIFGDYTGALVAESNLKFMWELVDQIKIGKNGHAYVVDKEGYLIAFHDISRVLKRENLTYLEEVHLAVTNNHPENVTEANVVKGILKDLVLTTHVRLTLPQWTVVVELPVREAYHTIFISLILSGLVILLSIFLSIVSGIYISRRVTRPIIQLRDATEKIGKGQLTSKIDIKSNNEIGDLASSFNTMVEDLNNTTVSRDALAKEIHERRQAEQTLRESEQELSAILTASPIGICLVNNKRLDWANETFFNMVGYDKKNLLGENLSLLSADEKEYDQICRRLYLGDAGQKIGHVETKLIRQDGKSFDCSLSSCSLDPQNPSKGQIITVSDISESKRLQSKLVHAQKMEAIGTLASGVAHDLNNILIGLVGYPELILMNMAKNNPLRKPLETIEQSGKKAATIVQDLLTLARRGVKVNEVVNLNNIISDYLKSPEYENLKSFNQSITITTDLEPHLFNIVGSCFHLLKTIMNLVNNAAESISEEGEILIATKNQYIESPVKGFEIIEEGEYVTLSVTDNGIGISKEDRKNIFEPFYTKKKMGKSGTGLGMAVIWGTVKDHNGFIDLQSTVGEGTTFTLYFPLSRKEIIEEKSSVTLDNYKANGETILIIDDVEEQRLIVSQMVTRLGYKVDSVASGEEAVEYLKNNSADLLLLDMIMDPGIDGLETYKQIIQIHPGQKALITSGYSETERVKEAQKLGAGAYVKKPYNLEIISQVIREELSK